MPTETGKQQYIESKDEATKLHKKMGSATKSAKGLMSDTYVKAGVHSQSTVMIDDFNNYEGETPIFTGTTDTSAPEYSTSQRYFFEQFAHSSFRVQRLTVIPTNNIYQRCRSNATTWTAWKQL